jgi:hypothetical protein
MNAPPVPPRPPPRPPLPRLSDVPPTTFQSVPPPSALPSIPVVSIQPDGIGGGHVLSLMPGSRLTAPALPRAPWRKILDGVIVLAAIGTLCTWGIVNPEQVPTLIGVLGVAMGYYFRARKPRAETTAGELPRALPRVTADGESDPP